MSKQEFISVGDHYERLAATLDGEQLRLYSSMKHKRPEVCFRGRTFVLYRVQNRQAVQVDHITVQDLVIADDTGASTELRRANGDTMIVGYTPAQVFEHPVFVHIPLQSKIRWATTPDNVNGGTMSFELCVRTASRLHLFERGITYMETGVTFAREVQNRAQRETA